MQNTMIERAGGLALAAAVLALPAAAAEQNVSFKSGPDTVSAILYTPDRPGAAPGMLVIHEWWGLDGWVKQQAQNLAKEGYAALAVDLYRGKVTNKQEEAHQLMMGTPRDRALRDLKAAYAFLQTRPEVRKDRIGVIGWCMGGMYALALATEEPGLGAVVAYYGAPPTDPAALARIKAPVLGNYGAEDKGPSPDQVRAFEKEMKAAGKTVDVKIYEGAGHAFANVNNPWKGYREAAATDAWSRTVGFLDRNLKK
jgi:carboxymethylenebutenolidase